MVDAHLRRQEPRTPAIKNYIDEADKVGTPLKNALDHAKKLVVDVAEYM